MGNVGLNQYFGNDQQLTDGLVDQLKWELTKRCITISDTTDKSIELKVVHYCVNDPVSPCLILTDRRFFS